MNQTVLIGCDPELFLKHKKTGEYISAFGLLPGSKDHPHPVEGGAIQVDGNAVEFNIEPAATEDEFVSRIYSMLKLIDDLVKKQNSDLELVTDPVAMFAGDVWETLPLQAKELGCEPDFNAVTGQPNPSKEEMTDIPVRTSGGHIHIGYSSNDKPFNKAIFRERMACAKKIIDDLNAVAPTWEQEESNQRRKYYGGGYACRPKPYGVEIRTLDSTWLKSEASIRRVYQTAKKSFEEYANAS